MLNVRFISLEHLLRLTKLMTRVGLIKYATFWFWGQKVTFLTLQLKNILYPKTPQKRLTECVCFTKIYLVVEFVQFSSFHEFPSLWLIRKDSMYVLAKKYCFYFLMFMICSHDVQMRSSRRWVNWYSSGSERVNLTSLRRPNGSSTRPASPSSIWISSGIEPRLSPLNPTGWR